MTVTSLLARAKSQIGQGTSYGLGRGVTLGDSPRDETGACDCSAFVCWCLNLRKRQTQFSWLTKLNGGWYNTDGIWWDATKESTGFFEQVKAPQPGALVVFPSRAVSQVAGPKIGHVGLISEVKADGEYRVIHCSNGNFKNTGDAIRETDSGVFKPSSTIFAWAALL